ncbi:MAG: hypothetical protein KAI66_28285, partial [Lentisphaeria bacterium]|nr:hypothetical protein [Lentisphaeria bacterium]
ATRAHTPAKHTPAMNVFRRIMPPPFCLPQNPLPGTSKPCEGQPTALHSSRSRGTSSPRLTQMTR